MASILGFSLCFFWLKVPPILHIPCLLLVSIPIFLPSGFSLTDANGLVSTLRVLLLNSFADTKFTSRFPYAALLRPILPTNDILTIPRVTSSTPDAPRLRRDPVVPRLRDAHRPHPVSGRSPLFSPGPSAPPQPSGPSALDLLPESSSAPNCDPAASSHPVYGRSPPLSTFFYSVYHGPPRARPPDWPEVPDHELESVSPLEGEDYLFFVQPAQEPMEQHAASAYAEIAIEYAENGARRVPRGPKPDAGRPKKKYKPVAKKVRPLQEHLPQEYRIERHRPSDCMDSLPALPTHPPPWAPTTDHLTQERMDGFDIGRDTSGGGNGMRLDQFK
ncbi:hypothetical protein AURDEDRAFT_173882 [Auricularia subglabra TFB-10046 SS5]|nr:hypothetical protein AURDEDRAFT_173882 [Auricularia subglabra TFB-10046 SS5]